MGRRKKIPVDEVPVVSDATNDATDDVTNVIKEEESNEPHKEEEKKPKKRGRKPKPKPENEEVTGPRRRGRRKKYTVDSIKKLRGPDDEEDKVTFASNNEHLKNLKQIPVSFGALNLTVHEEAEQDPTELRKMFDEKFKMKEEEKAPTVLVQERGTKMSIKKKHSQKTIFDYDNPNDSIIVPDSSMSKSRNDSVTDDEGENSDEIEEKTMFDSLKAKS